MDLRRAERSPDWAGAQVITFQRDPARAVGRLTMGAFAALVTRFFGRSTNRPGGEPGFFIRAPATKSPRRRGPARHSLRRVGALAKMFAATPNHVSLPNRPPQPSEFRSAV